MKRNELASAVQTRLKKGAKKETIYGELKETFGAAAVERSLAQWPYPAAKEKNRPFNVTLLIIAAFFAALTALQLIGNGPALTAHQLAGGILILLLQVYLIYGLLHANLIAYLLVILFGLRNIIGTLSIGTLSPNALILLALSFTAIVLAWMQKSRLFPNTSWLLRHKKDSAGNIIF